MLKLIVGRTEEESGVVQSPSIPVRWCVDEETRKALSTREIVNPHILLVTICGEKEQTRQLAPLEDVMCYVQLQKPGQNTLAATIVWDEEGSKNELWKKFLRKEKGQYQTDLVDTEGDFLGENLRCAFEKFAVDVVVPEELFAAKPLDWGWVNYYYKSLPRDQCEFRKRRFFAYSAQPFVITLSFFIWWVIQSVTILALLSVGARLSKLNWKILFVRPWKHLWKNQIWDTWCGHTRRPYEQWFYLHRFWQEKTGFEHVWSFVWTLMPAIWVVLSIIFFLAFNLENVKQPSGSNTQEFVAWSEVRIVMPLYYVFIVAMVVNGLLFLVDVSRRIYFRLEMVREANKPERDRLRKEKLEKEAREYVGKYFSNEYQPVFCEQGNLIANIDALPSEKRTIWLRFYDLKAKVCKPFPV